MKKPILASLKVCFWSCFAAASLASAQNSSAGMLALEPFQYANGALTGDNGGSGFSAAWATAGSGGAYVVNNGVVNNPPGATGFNTATRTFASTVTSAFAAGSTIYISLNFADTASNYGIFALYNGSTELLDIEQNTAAVGFWGLRNGGSSLVTSAVSDTTLKTGVIQLTIGTGATSTANLWVGSGVGAVNTSRTPDATLGGLNLVGVTTLSLGSNPNNANPVITFGDFRFGTTLADVNAVPEPGACALMLGGAGVLVAIRRRRRA